MKDIPLGLSHTMRHTVTADDSAPHLSVPVLATPTMIGMIEHCCMLATLPHMDEGETTVGAHVCVSHQAPTFVDEEYTIHIVLTQIEGRRLTYEIDGRQRARAGSAVGTHERGIVNYSKFG